MPTYETYETAKDQLRLDEFQGCPDTITWPLVLTAGGLGLLYLPLVLLPLMILGIRTILAIAWHMRMHTNTRTVAATARAHPEFVRRYWAKVNANH